MVDDGSWKAFLHQLDDVWLLTVPGKHASVRWIMDDVLTMNPERVSIIHPHLDDVWLTTVPEKHASVRWITCGSRWFLESILPSAG